MATALRAAFFSLAAGSLLGCARLPDHAAPKAEVIDRPEQQERWWNQVQSQLSGASE